MSTRFFTNDDSNTLLKKFEGIFENNPDLVRFNLEDTVTLLPAGSTLWAMMSPNHGMGGPRIGTKLAQLEPCECELEGFPRLSERYESTRKSHSGNVFTKVFFMEGNRLLPLEELRVREVAKLEKRLYQQSGELPLDSQQPEGHD
jgi:hypothetical protein